MEDSEASSSASTASLPTPIKVPANTKENRILKAGLVEPNNTDHNYVQLPLIFPSVLFSFLSLSAFIGAIALSYMNDVIPTDEQMRRGVLLSYGSIRLACNTTAPFPKDGLPSVLLLFERNSSGNILFRIATCLPIMLRIFQSLSMRHMVRAKQKCGAVFEMTSDVMPALTAVESFSIALFSIMTIHSDFPMANRFAKLSFAISASLNMLATTLIIFNFKSKTKNPLETLSVGVKIVSLFVFCYLSPQYFQYHHTVSLQPMCHSYLPRIYAVLEYILVVSYALFHLSWLIDIRDLHFLCYPRSCSGECEPLEPTNYVRGAKYEHCRAFEERQWQRRMRVGEEKEEKDGGGGDVRM
ncbi:hypothetical protein PRIPAC_93940 [Pristionchus pacificus]|uniref:Uncharacterized protein n=1 Tax=Pristionchus pacificus TaxID=54126 RepID=A0A2A6BPM9_PRIPA|nr:hypothetical protein PRIPAC_93940 [Pristionchus pacificus]|eukprot:PDM67869.1 hypothetical protein PRIPAC_45913 [Pristionchus pacificus]